MPKGAEFAAIITELGYNWVTGWAMPNLRHGRLQHQLPARQSAQFPLCIRNLQNGGTPVAPMMAYIALSACWLAIAALWARIFILKKENAGLRAQLAKKPRAPRTVADKYRKAIEKHRAIATDQYNPDNPRPQDIELYSVLPEATPADLKGTDA